MYQILIVDDREIFRRQFKRFPVFRDNSCFQVCFEAQNGKEALEILKVQRIDLLITDIRMPIMDGLELLKIVKEEDLCACVILLSEYTDFSYAKQGIVLGAFDYIVKPINNRDLEELLERCRNYLDSLDDKRYLGNEYKILPTLLLNNDSYAASISNQIAKRISEGEKRTESETRMDFERVLMEIRKKLSQEAPHMEMFCDFNELFSFDRKISKEDMAKSFCKQILNVQNELNKFSVHSNHALVQSVCNTIVKNIENDLSLQSLADLHLVNKAYLSHLFKRETGINFIDYLTMVKMERAKMLLLHTDEKIYAIAKKLGYSDTEYFSKQFKKYSGKTATEFRRSGEGQGSCK